MACDSFRFSFGVFIITLLLHCSSVTHSTKCFFMVKYSNKQLVSLHTLSHSPCVVHLKASDHCQCATQRNLFPGLRHYYRYRMLLFRMTIRALHYEFNFIAQNISVLRSSTRLFVLFIITNIPYVNTDKV